MNKLGPTRRSPNECQVCGKVVKLLIHHDNGFVICRDCEYNAKQQRIREQEEAFRAIDDHHHNFGGFLKLGEAYVTQELHKWYHLKRSNPKVIRQLEKLIKVIQETRPVMDSERLRALQAREPHALPAAEMEAGNDVYYGNELAQLQQSAYRAKTMRGVLREGSWWHGDKEPEKEQRELENAISNVVNTAHRRPWLLPEAATPAITDRHANLRAALRENPDQPQADFVKLCRVHPNTVRRTRRELEEAGVIPFLEHRHAA
jgi:hypothetical protein